MRRIVANLPAEARFEIHARIGVAAGRSSDLQAPTPSKCNRLRSNGVST